MTRKFTCDRCKRRYPIGEHFVCQGDAVVRPYPKGRV